MLSVGCLSVAAVLFSLAAFETIQLIRGR